MKTNNLKLIMLLLCLGGFMTIEAQGLYNLATLDDEDHRNRIRGIYDDVDLDFDDIGSAFDDGITWADNTIGGSVGFGWQDDDGNSETSYCVGAEYLHRITGERQNPRGAGYLGAFASYHKSNSDNFDDSMLRAGAKYSYFDPISTFNEAQLIYGANAYYETGNREFSGFKEDVSGYGASLYTGINVRLCDRASVGVEIPVISFASTTFEAGGSEVTRDRFRIGVNKDNMVSATLRWVLDTLDTIPD